MHPCRRPIPEASQTPPEQNDDDRPSVPPVHAAASSVRSRLPGAADRTGDPTHVTGVRPAQLNSGRAADDGRLTDPGRAPCPAEYPRQRALDLFGQPDRGIFPATLPGRVRREASHNSGQCCRSRRADRSAVPALDLAQTPDQVDARADRTPVQISRPVEGGLTAGADEHLTVLPHPALPGTLPPVGVDLPGATAIAGHAACSDPAVLPELRLCASRAPPGPSGTRRCHAPAGSG